MDEQDLEKTLIDAARSSLRDVDVSTPAETLDEHEELDTLIRNEARRVQIEFRSVTDAADRHQLQQRYEQLDRWLGEYNATGSELERRELRATVLEQMRLWRSGDTTRHRQDEERRRKLRQHESAKAGLAVNRRIRTEVELLLKDYTSSNDYKIESLLDKWRRSGDPTYDSSYAMRLRNARRKRMG